VIKTAHRIGYRFAIDALDRILTRAG